MSEAKIEEEEEETSLVSKKDQLLVVNEVELKFLPKIGDKIMRRPNPKVVFMMSLPDTPPEEFHSIQMTKRKQKRCNIKFSSTLAFAVPNVESVHFKIETWHVTTLITGSEDRLIGDSLSFNLDLDTLKTESNSKTFILPIGARNEEKKEETILSFQIQWVPEDTTGKHHKSLKKSERMMVKYEKMKKSASNAKIRFQRIDDLTPELDEETNERYQNYSRTFARDFKDLRVFYVHGLESSPQGPKPTYLKGKVKFIHGMDMDISCYKLTKDVNFPKFLLKTLFSKNVIKGLNRKFVLKKMVDVCVGKQIEELKKHPEYFDLYVGSSWGGAVLIELLRALKIIPFDAMVLLLAPAQNLVKPNFEVSEEMKESYRFVYLVHGEKDEIVGVKHSRKLDTDLGVNCEYKEIKDAPHNLRVLLNEKPGGIEDIIQQMIQKRNRIIDQEKEEEEEEGEEEEEVKE